MTRSVRYRKYRSRVRALTAEAREQVDYRRGHTLDHVVPVSYGFRHDIPEELIGCRENLELVPYQDNIEKGQQITDKGCALLRRWGYKHLADAAESRRVAA